MEERKHIVTLKGEPAARAKYTILHGKEHSTGELAIWKAVEDIITGFTAADKYVMAVPMWNFGIPYRLKQYIDLIVQPGYTFSFTPEEGYKGLVTGKPVLVAYARGGEYAEGSASAAYDLQKPYMEAVLAFIGFTDVRSIVIEPTLAGGPDTASAKGNAAISEAREMATDF